MTFFDRYWICCHLRVVERCSFVLPGSNGRHEITSMHFLKPLLWSQPGKQMLRVRLCLLVPLALPTANLFLSSLLSWLQNVSGFLTGLFTRLFPRRPHRVCLMIRKNNKICIIISFGTIAHVLTTRSCFCSYEPMLSGHALTEMMFEATNYCRYDSPANK